MRIEEMKKHGCKMFAVIVGAMMFAGAMTGCNSTAKSVAASAGGKNLDLSGYVLLGEAEMANEATATPQGKMILGRVTYKSRKVGIPGDQKVPNTANFRATKSTGLLGTTDIIYEYDWTAGSDKDAKEAEKKCQALKEKAAAEFEKEHVGNAAADAEPAAKTVTEAK